LDEQKISGTLLRLYMHENDQHEGRLLWDTIMRHANKEGISGCSVFKAIAGFGSHHSIHKGPMPFELHGVQTVRMDFLVTDAESIQLIDWSRRQGLRLFYTTTPAGFGTINAQEVA